MNATGRVIVYRMPEAFRCRSTFTFDSKCGIPVSPSAEATEDITTWGTCAAFAASIAVVPWRTSFSTSTEKSGLNGVVMKKNASTPRRAGTRLALSVRSPRTPSSRRPLSSLIFSGFRVSPRTRWPRFIKARATDPPCCPVAPATRIVFVSTIVSTRPAIAAPAQDDWVREARVTRPRGGRWSYRSAFHIGTTFFTSSIAHEAAANASARPAAHRRHQGDLVPLAQLHGRFRELVVHREDHRLLIALEPGMFRVD